MAFALDWAERFELSERLQRLEPGNVCNQSDEGGPYAGANHEVSRRDVAGFKRSRCCLRRRGAAENSQAMSSRKLLLPADRRDVHLWHQRHSANDPDRPGRTGSGCLSANTQRCKLCSGIFRAGSGDDRRRVRWRARAWKDLAKLAQLSAIPDCSNRSSGSSPFKPRKPRMCFAAANPCRLQDLPLFQHHLSSFFACCFGNCPNMDC